MRIHRSVVYGVECGGFVVHGGMEDARSAGSFAGVEIESSAWHVVGVVGWECHVKLVGLDVVVEIGVVVIVVIVKCAAGGDVGFAAF
jgi:hypothetical protein